jgi:hypothetical protein
MILEDRMKAKGTHAMQIPLFLWTAYHDSFKLMVVMYARETNRDYIWPWEEDKR